jgi:anti-anti-sigma factor
MPKSAHRCAGDAGGCTRLADCAGVTRLTVCVRPDGDRMVVALGGDLDLTADQELQQALRSALLRSDQGIDLDLSGVEFCDCSGLNALLGIRQQALEQSKTATIRGISPAAERVFALTDTLPLFEPEDEPATEPATKLGAEHVPEDGPEDGPEDRADEHPEETPAGTTPDPRVEVVQLRRAMQTRGLIDLARGILMATFTLSAEEAWTVLVMTSQNTNTKLHRGAQQLVDSVRGDALPDPVRRQLSAAVGHVTAERGRR